MNEVNTNLEDLSGRDLIDHVLAVRKWSLDQLSEELPYAVRTLKGVRSGEVPLSPKLQRLLTKKVTNLDGSRVRDAEHPDSQSKRWGPPQDMPPPHHQLQIQIGSRSEKPAEPLQHADYVQACSWLSTLFDRYPDAFRTAVTMIKGLHDLVVKK